MGHFEGKIVALEKLLFLKALAIKVPKYRQDLELVVDCWQPLAGQKTRASIRLSGKWLAKV